MIEHGSGIHHRSLLVLGLTDARAWTLPLFLLRLPFGALANLVDPIRPSLGHAFAMLERDQPHAAMHKLNLVPPG